MREIIARVVEAEAAARKQVANARAEAERLVVEARRQAQEIRESLRGQTRAEAEAIQAVALREADATRRDRLAVAVAELDTTIQIHDAFRREVVGEAVQRVTEGLGRAR